VIPLLHVGLIAMIQLSDTTRVFPSIEGRNLEGQTLVMPRDFAGEMNVVFVAFKREQQADVDSWGPALDTFRARYPALRVYELPTLGRRYRFMRAIIDGGMRGGIPDPAVRAATVTRYMDKDPFKRALSIHTEDQLQILLVDRTGRLRWQRSGPCTPSLRVELQAHVLR
jgi:hypothetical protein